MSSKGPETSGHRRGADAHAWAAARPGPRLSRRGFVLSASAAATSALLVERGRVLAQEPGATPVATPIGGEAAGPVRGGEVRLDRPGSSLENFNPAAFAQDRQIPHSYLEPLVRPNPDTLRPEPCLASGWSWRNDGIELQFTLRDDVLWHDGERFDAEDAAFSLAVYRDDIESLVSGHFSLVESIEATAEGDVLIRFTARDANWLFNAATLPVFSRRQYEAYWSAEPEGARTLSGFDWAAATPVGTGPWRIDSWDADEVTFSRFDRHWRDEPWLDSLKVSVERGAAHRIEAWEAGESQLVWPVDVKTVERLDGSAGTLVAAPAASVMFAAFNFANPLQPNGSLWTDLNVRRAASLAIDRNRYADEVFGGHVDANASGTVAQPWAYQPPAEPIQTNRELAEVLLAEAGWLDYDGDGILDDGYGTPLRPVVIVQEGSRPDLLRVLAHVTRDLATIGIALEIEVLPPADFEERWIVRRDYDLIAYAYDLLPGFTDYDLYGSAWDIRSNPAGWNPGGYSNPDADVAIEHFLAAVSIERQRAALAQLQQAVNDDLFGLWFGFPKDLILVADGVAGFEPDLAWQTARTWKLWLTDG